MSPKKYDFGVISVLVYVAHQESVMDNKSLHDCFLSCWMDFVTMLRSIGPSTEKLHLVAATAVWVQNASLTIFCPVKCPDFMAAVSCVGITWEREEGAQVMN
jgi:hypothetical protein